SGGPGPGARARPAGPGRDVYLPRRDAAPEPKRDLEGAGGLADVRVVAGETSVRRVVVRVLVRREPAVGGGHRFVGVAPHLVLGGASRETHGDGDRRRL